MMIPEQESFLRWLMGQPAPVTQTEIENSSAPGYTRERLRFLFEEGYISRRNKVCSNSCFSDFYFITDKGREALHQLDEERYKEAKQERQQRFVNNISIASVLVPAVTFLLGMLVEHFSGIIGILSAFFR